MVNIQPVSVWKDGSVKTASKFSLVSINDSLISSGSAQFYYQLIEGDSVDEDGNTIAGQFVQGGNWGLSGDDYDAWSGSNTEIYELAAAALNLTIV